MSADAALPFVLSLIDQRQYEPGLFANAGILELYRFPATNFGMLISELLELSTELAQQATGQRDKQFLPCGVNDFETDGLVIRIYHRSDLMTRNNIVGTLAHWISCW